MKWAVAQGFREDNPAGDAIGVALPKTGQQRQHQRALPHGEVAAALATVRDSGAWPADETCFRVSGLDGLPGRVKSGVHNGTRSTAILGRCRASA